MLAKLYVYFLLGIICVNAWKLEIFNNENFDFNVGKNAQVICRVMSNNTEPKNVVPIIKWYKNNVEVPDEMTYQRGMSKGQILSKTLYFHNPSYEDNGNYSCRVNINDEIKSLASQFLFKVGAKFVNTSAEQYAISKTHARIICNVEGDNITVDWLHDGKVLMHSKKHDIAKQDNTLIIYDYSIDDRGVYTCRWHQNGKQGKLDIDVVTYEKPTIIEFDNPPETYEGSNFTMKCLVKGKPTPHVYWQKVDDDDSPIGTKMPGAELTLNNINASNAGTYKCIANATFDEVERKQYISVITKPNIVEIDDQIAESGQTVTLQCLFFGEGVLTAQWLKNDVVKKEITFASSNVTQELNLTLNSVEISDMSVYECKIANKAGSSIEAVMITVNGPPIVSVAKSKIFATSPSTVELNCSAKSHPPAEWQWFFNNGTSKINLAKASHVQFAESDGGSRLVISEFLVTHLGNYTCVAKNAYGNDSKIIAVVKQVPPSISSLKCLKGLTPTSIHCVDPNEVNDSTDNSPQSYIVYYYEGSKRDECCSNGKNLTDCGATQTEVQNKAGHLWIEGMKPNTGYVLQIVAKNAAGHSNATACITAETGAPSTPVVTSYWPVVIYIVVAILALILLVDLCCCLSCQKGMFAACYRRCRRRSNKQVITIDEESPSEVNPFVEEEETITYESNFVRAGPISELETLNV